MKTRFSIVLVQNKLFGNVALAVIVCECGPYFHKAILRRSVPIVTNATLLAKLRQILR